MFRNWGRFVAKITYLSPWFLCSFILLLLYTKGSSSTIATNEDLHTSLLSPFELSTSSSRYALTKSVVDNHTFFLSYSLARFSAPDLVFYHGKFISIFTPGVSFIGIPLYYLGHIIGQPQLFTFFTTDIFAFLNLLLIARLSHMFGARGYICYLCGFVFLFGTNALGFSQTFTQHHVSSVLLLLSILLAIGKPTTKSAIIMGFLFSTALLIDIPNGIFMLPSLLYGLYLAVAKKPFANLARIPFAFLIGSLPCLLIFGYYNVSTTASPVKIGQLLGRTDFFRSSLSVQNPAEYKHTEIPQGIQIGPIPFEVHNPIPGAYILLLSNQRSWIYYSPVILLGFIGLLLSLRHPATKSISLLCLSIVACNIFLYATFDDPWGGWAFGPRYLIPSAAILAGGLGMFFTYAKRHAVLLFLFLSLFTYSSYVSSLGALTTNAVPPRFAAIYLNPPLAYTYAFNQSFIAKNLSSNLLYNTLFFRYISEQTYLLLLTSITIVIAVTLVIAEFKRSMTQR